MLRPQGTLLQAASRPRRPRPLIGLPALPPGSFLLAEVAGTPAWLTGSDGPPSCAPSEG